MFLEEIVKITRTQSLPTIYEHIEPKNGFSSFNYSCPKELNKMTNEEILDRMLFYHPMLSKHVFTPFNRSSAIKEIILMSKAIGK